MFFIIVCFIAAWALIGLPGCGGGATGGGGGGDDDEARIPEPKKYDVALGEEVIVLKQQVDIAGGMITVAEPGNPIDGLTITVKPGSYSATLDFQVSYAPIEATARYPNLNPISPLVIIDNGGGYSSEIMEVNIPVQVPEGHFAMGFVYDRNSKTIEGLPVLSTDQSSVTVGTRHFSDILVTSIALELLDSLVQKGADSGFKPGADDWQFPNYGSILAPGGHCAGQSISAMWYFCERRERGRPALFGLYDNNDNADAKTPMIWQDDIWGYKFASTVQNNIQWDSDIVRLMRAMSSIDDLLTWRAIAYSILLTGEPQYISVRNDGGGHALVAYNVQGNSIFVADPNYPGQEDRAVEFAGGVFRPYNSGADAEHLGVDHPVIQYLAKTGMIDWASMGQWWDEIVVGRDDFPKYRINVTVGGKMSRLAGEFETSAEQFELEPEIVDRESIGEIALLAFRGGENAPTRLAEENGVYSLEFRPSDDRLGILVLGNGEWLGFHWIIRPGSRPEQATEKVNLKIRLQKGYTYDLQMTTDQDIEQEVQGRKMDAKNITGMGFILEVIDVPQPGQFYVKLTYRSMAMKMDAMGTSVDYDSSRPDEYVPPEAQGVAALVGESIYATITEDGRTIDIQGFDELLDKVFNKIDIPYGEQGEMLKNQMKAQFGEEALKGVFDQITPYYPSYPVGPGDSWNQSIDLSGMIPIMMDINYTFRERKAGMIIIDMTAQVRSSNEPLDMGPISMRFNLTGSSTGWMEVYETTGMMSKGETDMTFSGSMNVAYSGQTLDIPLSAKAKAVFEEIKQ